MTKTGAMLEPWRLTAVHSHRTHSNRTGFKLALLALALLVLLAGCRNETQNRIRRDLQDYTGRRTYITVYSVNGTPIFEGVVDGQVTRSVSDVNAGAATELSPYVYWFDAEGQYYQTDMPYLLSSRAPEGAASTTAE